MLSAGLCCLVAGDKFTSALEEWWQAVFFSVAVMRTSDINFFYVHFLHHIQKGVQLKMKPRNMASLRVSSCNVYNINSCMFEMVLKVTSLNSRHDCCQVNRSLNIVWSYFLEIANAACWMKQTPRDSHIASTTVACVVTLNHLTS